MAIRFKRLSTVLVAMALGLTAAACGSDDDDATSDTEPADVPATEPAEDDAPADTAGSETTEPAEDDAPEETAEPAGSETTEPAEPSGETVEYSFAMGSPGLIGAFVLETLERVEAETGHQGEFVELADSDLVVQGAAEGQFDMGSSTTSAVMTVIQNGAELVFVGESSFNQWTLIAKNEIESCADMDGQRLGLHSPGGVSTALYRTWYGRNCENVEPTELYIEGSPNRLQALIEDQVDVSMVELEDVLALPEGEFRMLANFAQELSDIKTNLVYANTGFVEEHPDVVQAFVTEMVALQQQAMEDADFFIGLLEKWDIDTAAPVDVVVNAYIEQGMLPTDGGMTQSDLEASIALYTEAGRIEPGLTPEEIADRSFIEGALGQ